MSIRKTFKHGIARLTAAAEGGCFSDSATRLTQVSHKAPMRLVPIWKSSVDKAGAAVCALSNYGGGMLQGDSVELHVHVKPQARLGVTTQGASRIYTQRLPNSNNNLCQATLEAKVDPHALLVWAPDPCALFQKSSFEQSQTFSIHPSSSVALIDWFSSGRYRNGEHWAFHQLSTKTLLKFPNEEIPFLQDAIHMDLRANEQRQLTPWDDPLGVSNFHAFASLILYGDQVQQVRERCEALSDVLLAKHTRIRERNSLGIEEHSGYHVSLEDLGLSGRVCMGTSQVKLSSTSTVENDTEALQRKAHVVRLAATTNEDLYRIFHYCLQPLQPKFGLEFYKERIRAKKSEIPRAAGPAIDQVSIHSLHEPATKTDENFQSQEAPSDKYSVAEVNLGISNNNESAMWSAYMLADSALPTGSFAHSAGLEVAAQLGLIQTRQQLDTFIQAATRSTMQISAPFLVAGHDLVSSVGYKSDDTKHVSEVHDLVAEWKRLNQQAQAVLAPNAPACAASLDQGKSLARVAQQWLQEDDPLRDRLLVCFEHGYHVGPVLGALASRMGLHSEEVALLFGYCAARDMVSAAVRLSLVGPLASVESLQNAQTASRDGWATYRHKLSRLSEAETKDPMAVAAACAPVIEALHPCHDQLQVRLFRT